jgi:threonine synthase
VVPVAQFGASTFLLELFHGPTLAFKDVAMQLLARLMDHALAARGERTTIVVATSGDTGGAAVEAFRGRERADLFVLFPHGRVSDVQRRMMTTANDNNVHAIAVDGTFDDCQALVKGLFNHHAFRDRVRLSGVNSINWARIVAQVVYYFTAAATLGAPHRKMSFTVPTGNFGDIFAGYVAERMGLPVDRLVIATNVNDILARTIATGTYDVREVVATSSPSMDIQVSSNFERLLFEATGRDAAEVRAQMASLTQSRRFSLSSRALSRVRALFNADRADEEETAATIRTALRETSRLIDPHTAVALAVAEKETRDSAVPMIVLGTAHPAKFPDAVEAACGIRPALPDWLSDLPERPERATPMAIDQGAIEKFILAASRAAREGAAA